jgi:PBSX family phage terminase large subunit
MTAVRLRARASIPQVQLVNSKAPFPAFVGGFGSGKTHALILRTLSCLFGNGRDFAYYLPTYDLVRTIGYPRFQETLGNMGVSYVVNKAAHTIEVNGKTLYFRTLDNPDRIVGYEVSDSAVDELDTLPTEKARRAWQQVIARNRQKKEAGINTVAVGTTPEGFRFVHEQWVKNKTPSYELIQAPTESNSKHLPPNYIEVLRETYPPNLLKAYLNGEFVNLTSGTVYASYDRERHDSRERIKEREPLYIGCDFNVTKQAATVYVQRGEAWHAVQELVDMYDTREMISLIQEKWQSNGHPIYIYPDASGGSRKSVDASISDIALLEQAGFFVRAKKQNPAVRDRIIATNAAFEKGRLFVNSYACPTVAECLEQQVYKNGEPDKSSGKDHQNDATTYPIAYEMPIVKPVASVNFNFAV